MSFWSISATLQAKDHKWKGNLWKDMSGRVWNGSGRRDEYMRKRMGRPAPRSALIWVTGLFLLGFGLSTVYSAAVDLDVDRPVVARHGALEEAWDVSFHVTVTERPDRTWLSVALPHVRAQRLAEGDEAVLRLPGTNGQGQREVLAKVAEISVPVDGIVHVMFVTPGTSAATPLHAGVPGRIVVRSGPFGTVIPVSALHPGTDNAGEGVYVVRTAGPGWVPVRVIARSLTEAVVEGITPGTKLAAKPRH